MAVGAVCPGSCCGNNRSSYRRVLVHSPRHQAGLRVCHHGKPRSAPHKESARAQSPPNWQERLPNGRMPAPPHDASGHTWHHPDDMLFRITKEGVSAVVPGYESDMPAFVGVLSDEEIRAVLAFIKTSWPERERRNQEARSQSRKQT